MNKPVPMRLAKREISDPDAIKDIIEQCHTVRIGIVDEHGVFIVPMSFGYSFDTRSDGETSLTLWLHSASEGRKARCFDACPEVAFEMDIEDGVIQGSYSCSYSLAYRSVMGSGVIHKVEDSDAKAAGLAHIMEHMAPGAGSEFSNEALERCSVWRIDASWVSAKQRTAKQ